MLLEQFLFERAYQGRCRGVAVEVVRWQAGDYNDWTAFIGFTHGHHRSRRKLVGNCNLCHAQHTTEAVEATTFVDDRV